MRTSRAGAIVSFALALACAPRATPPHPQDVPERPTPAPVADADPIDPRALQQFVTARVQQGFADRDEIVDAVVDMFADADDLEQLRALAERACDRALAEHAAQERSWREPTDCDRLDRAFAELEASGILARQKYSDCQTCGADEIRTEAKAAIAGGARIRGFVFYHDQDAEAVLGGTLHLAYDDIDGTEAGALAIGKAVVAALESWGLATSWDGSCAQRIAIVDLEWKRRRTTRAPTISPGRRDVRTTPTRRSTAPSP